MSSTNKKAQSTPIKSQQRSITPDSINTTSGATAQTHVLSSSSSNNIISKSEDIAVVCRVRPPLSDEVKGNGGNGLAVKVKYPNGITIENDHGVHEFAFDCVLGPESTQDDVFQNVGKNVVDCVLDGFNSTIF